MAVPYTFGTATSSIPLSQLDSNFNTVITLGNTAIQLGNTVTTLNNMTLANVTISSGNVTITNVSITTANVTTANITTAVIGTETVTTSTITTANVTTANITTDNITNGTVITSLTLSYGTANGVAYLNGSKVLTSGSALTFDGTNLKVAGETAITAGSQSTLNALHLYFDTATNTSFIKSYHASVDDRDLVVGGKSIAFQVPNGTEIGRFTSTGLGIGTSSPTQKLDVYGTGMKVNNASYVGYLGSGSTFASGATTDFCVRSDNVLSFATGGPYERMRIDSSGNLGLGVTPSAWGTAYRTAIQVGAAACFSGTSGSSATDYFAIGGNFYLNSSASYRYITSAAANRLEASVGEFRFYNAPSGTAGNAITFTQAMTLDASGNLLVGTTSNVGAPARSVAIGNATYGALAAEAPGSGNGYPVWFRDTDATSASQQLVHFRRGASVVGYITTTNTATAYGSASDYRLKNTITPMLGALARVAQLKPVTYKWNSDNSDGEGFIAHQLQEVCPVAVHGTKDAVDDEGNPQYQGIDTSFLVATLTAAIQEQQALITSLTARITALEST
jgi:hypothetical protein